jgi:hypothetical protein
MPHVTWCYNPRFGLTLFGSTESSASHKLTVGVGAFLSMKCDSPPFRASPISLVCPLGILLRPHPASRILRSIEHVSDHEPSAPSLEFCRYGCADGRVLRMVIDNSCREPGSVRWLRAGTGGQSQCGASRCIGEIGATVRLSACGHRIGPHAGERRSSWHAACRTGHVASDRRIDPVRHRAI